MTGTPALPAQKRVVAKIPKAIYKQLKLRCVELEIPIGEFVRAGLSYLLKEGFRP